MPRVICDLPNASDEISGVKFYPLEDGGRISDEISQEQADRFASIPGYSIDDGAVEPPKPVEKPAPTTRKAAAKKAATVEPVVEPVAPPAEAGEGEEVF